MSKRIRVITALLVLIFSFSALTVTVHAAGNDSYSVGEPEEESQVDPAEPVATEPYVPDEPVATDPPYVPDEPVATEAPAPVNPDPGTGGGTDYSGGGTDYSGGGSQQQSTYQEFKPVDEYLGGGQSYVEPQTAASEAAMYKISTDKIADDSKLTSDDWNSLKDGLKNSDGTKTGSFASIQNDESTEDRLGWDVYLAYILCALGLAGIAYVVTSNILRRKKVKAGVGGYSAPSSARYGDYVATTMPDSKSSEKKTKRQSKFDTAEVKLPKSSGGSHYKGNGKRYK